MLVHRFKNLATHYCELAKRITIAGAFPTSLLYDVPIAFAGSYRKVGEMLKATALTGPVVLKPIAFVKVRTATAEEYENDMRHIWQEDVQVATFRVVR